jgi:hypothetical protein
MKTPAIFFGLAISACSVPAMAQNVNAIVSGSIGGIPFSLDGVNYPAATISPGTTANGATIAVGNINFYPGASPRSLSTAYGRSRRCQPPSSLRRFNTGARSASSTVPRP